MHTTLLEIELRGGVNRPPTTSRHGHTEQQVFLRRPGKVGTFYLDADTGRPVLRWRSTARSGR
jgi:hypothetical protein